MEAQARRAAGERRDHTERERGGSDDRTAASLRRCCDGSLVSLAAVTAGRRDETRHERPSDSCDSCDSWLTDDHSRVDAGEKRETTASASASTSRGGGGTTTTHRKLGDVTHALRRRRVVDASTAPQRERGVNAGGRVSSARAVPPPPHAVRDGRGRRQGGGGRGERERA